MLYLPASWFHEVTSYGDQSSEGLGHLAFNYWVHPPSTSDFDAPYTDDFWMDRWEQAQQQLLDLEHSKQKQHKTKETKNGNKKRELSEKQGENAEKKDKGKERESKKARKKKNEEDK